MKKKLFVICLALLSFVSQNVTAETYSGVDGIITWSLNTTTGVLTLNGNGSMKNYSFDSESYFYDSIDDRDYHVTDAPWGRYHNYISYVVIKPGVTSIGDDAFYNCLRLLSVTMPEGITSIGDDAFRDCHWLSSAAIPSSATIIGSGAFAGCLLQSVTIPGSVTSIGHGAFSGCKSLESVTIEYGLKSIAYGAFSGCESLTSIMIPTSVTNIEEVAFDDCYSLTSVTLPSSVTSIGDGAFAYCSHLPSITIPEGVTNIGSNAFLYCKGLTSITIPESVTSIGRAPFYESGLTSITMKAAAPCKTDVLSFPTSNEGFKIYVPYGAADAYKSAEGWSDYASFIVELEPEEVPIKPISDIDGNITWSLDTKTGVLTLSGNGQMNDYGSEDNPSPWRCYRDVINTIVVEDGIESIGEFAFYDLGTVSSVTLPQSVKGIGGYAFGACQITEPFTLPQNLLSIGQGTFGNLTGNWTLNIPSQVSEIGLIAFHCDDNISITVDADNAYFSSDEYCIFNKDKTELITCYRDGDSYAIPETVRSIAPNAFYTHNFNSVVIPDGMTKIGDSAFYGCGLQNVLIPEGVKTIGGMAFYFCGLTSINLPHTLQKIGGWAFYGCNNLETIYIPENVEIIEEAALSGADAIDVDASNPYFGSSNGVLYNKDQTKIMCLPYGMEKVAFTIPSTVTVIGGSAFWGNSQLTSITIPESVRIIETSAFAGCGMETINLPRTVTSIRDRAFFGCKNLKNLTIPKNVAIIEGGQTFYGCDNLEYIVLKGRHTPLNNVVEFFGAEGSHIPTIYVPSGSSEAYKSAAGWSEFADYIVEMEKDENDDLTSIYAGDIYLQRGGTAVLPIYMNNDVKVAGFQFNLCLPEGIEVDYTTARTGGVSYSTTVVKGDERFDDDINFSLSCQKQADGSMMVMCYSTDNDEIYDEDIEGNDIRQTAPLLYITLRGSADLELTDYTVMLSDIVISHYDKATGATSVYDLEYSNAKIEVVSTRYLAVVSNDAAKGTVAVEAANYDTETGEIDYGETATLTATPNDGYHFVRWTENDTELTTENPYSFNVTNDCSIVGEFAINQYRVQFVANGETVYDELLDYMSVITAPEAPAVSGMVFITWGEVDETVPTHDVIYTAEYAKLGDLYEDDRLNVGDITALAGIILNGGTDDARTFAMANVYQDDRLNVGDVTALAGIILNGGVASAPSLRRRAALAPLYSTEYNNDIYAGNICVEPGTKQVVLPVYLANNVSISGFQFQLYLPEGVKVAYTTGRNGISYTSTIVKGEDRFDSDINFTLSNQEQADGSMMIMCYSTVNDAIYDEDLSGNDCRLTSPVLNITLEIEDGFVGSAYKIEMKEKSLSHFDSTTDVFYPDNTQSLLSMQQTIDFSMSAAGWGSLILPFDAAVPEGLAAFSCTGVEEDGDKGWLTLVESKTLSANTPYIMKGEAGKYTFTGYPCNLNDSYDDGLLVGVMKDTEVGEGYVLQNQGGEVAFFQLASAKTIPANRCYLKSTTDITASSLGIREGDTTQIDELLYEDSADAAIYDLSGRKLTVNPEELSEGVYIINGKKTIIK